MMRFRKIQLMSLFQTLEYQLNQRLSKELTRQEKREYILNQKLEKLRQVVQEIRQDNDTSLQSILKKFKQYRIPINKYTWKISQISLPNKQNMYITYKIVDYFKGIKKYYIKETDK